MLIFVYINYYDIAHLVFVAVVTSGNPPTLWQKKTTVQLHIEWCQNSAFTW